MELKLIPTGGLCNRMRAIASCIAIAQKKHAHTTIYWNKYKGLNADFEELFFKITNANVLIVEKTEWLYNVNYTKDYIKRFLFYKIIHKQTFYNYNIYEKKEDLTGKIKENSNRSTLLISGHPMCKDYAETLRNTFRPQLEIQNRINEIVARFGEQTIGVHIRRTDNTASINNSPLESFKQIINDEISKNPKIKFYLATDDDKIKKQFIHQYGDKIITIFQDTNRDSLEGMKFAVIDLFCLSKTSKIIGSVSSSYSQIAADLGNIDIQYAK